MKLFFSAILLLLCLENNAQAPPVIQWQKCYGGSQYDIYNTILGTADGGYILTGTGNSNDGDFTGNRGSNDVWMIKIDATGNIQWKKNFGGSGNDQPTQTLQTPDGGYIFVGSTSSVDGDVTGNHGGGDLWVVKLDAAANLQWQKCYGGSKNDGGGSIYKTADGGYIIGGSTNSKDGDVTGLHGDTTDIWIVKIDAIGNLQWQKCYGGTKEDEFGKIIQTTDGGYFFTALIKSSDGDIACSNVVGDLWMVKLDNTGNIQWQHCLGDNGFGIGYDIQITPDNGFIIVGMDFIDALILKIDATGTVQWQKLYGGTNIDEASSIQLAPGGGYIVGATTRSKDGNICNNKGADDCWIMKLSDNGSIEWQKTYGGTQYDRVHNIILTTDGGYIVAGDAQSNNGDVSGNHSSSLTDDWWVFKLSFPGVPTLPSINIAASDQVICPGQNITFIATIADGGTTPSYQWTINGANAATDNDTVQINTLHNGDIVNCILTSSSACITGPGISNTIAITVDPSKTPANFLPLDTSICNYGTIDLKATNTYKTYLWSNNATTPVLTISQPGTYWLNVTTDADCPGSDTIVVLPKDCFKGFYMPSAFTPNGDGKNDMLKPILGGNIKQYKFTITNRWGQNVFQTTEIGQGWDGKFRGIKQDGNVFIWTCTYQFAGEEIKSLKGTVLLIR